MHRGRPGDCGCGGENIVLTINRFLNPDFVIARIVRVFLFNARFCGLREVQKSRLSPEIPGIHYCVIMGEAVASKGFVRTA